MNTFRSIPFLLLFFVINFWYPSHDAERNAEPPVSKDPVLRIVQNKSLETISIFRGAETKPIIVQNAKANFRPYLHPIEAPDGKGILTEYSPGHHKHQTGIYWGYTRVNGRDYFHHPDNGYWRRVSATVLEAKGLEVKWQTVYDLLDSTGTAVLTETQNWSMRQKDGKYLLDLEWSGEAKTDVTIGKYDYGGLFVRMPWKPGIKGEVVNAARQRNEKAEGQPAMWVDISMQIEGRNDLAHIAILDHPENKGYPQTWRVDGQLGAGPARARKGDWHIKKGETEVIKHELVIYTGLLNDVELTKTFGDFIGNNGTYNTAALWAVAQKEGREAKFLSATEAVAAMTVKEGFEVNAWASEPMMTQPMAFCWDDRGRMWIAENKDYESRGKGFSNSGDSRILILEDTDHDGVADKRTVFMEGIAFPSAIAVGFDGVFIGAPPNLLFVPDKNGDDKADADAVEVRLTGWGIRDRHETLNSFHWGPDGWLYGLQGFATPSKVGKPNGKGKIFRHNDPFPTDTLKEGTDINGGVWRYHPTKDKFEVVAHGFSNPWGIDYDAKGQLLMTACVIPHLWHVIPGGIYHRQGGQHFNPYVYNDIKTIADHSHRSAHGGARVYLSDAFPETEKGKLFMANIHEHGILSDILERKGSGFSGKHGDDFMMANNAQWVGFSMEVGPEGGLYVLDWHDADICGSDVLNSETGRIFRIMPKKSQAENWEGRYADLGKLSDHELVGLQTSKSEWHARRARIILQNRASRKSLSKEIYNELFTIYKKNTNPDFRLRALWALQITGGLDNEALLSALSDTDEHVRSWAVQFLTEDKKPGKEAIARFTQLAREDQSAVVRLYLASALQRLDYDDRWDIAKALLSHGEDSNDHNLPKMVWYGIEPLVQENTARALDLAVQSRIPMVTQFIARRTVDADVIERMVTLVGKKTSNQISLLEGMRDGLEGRTDLKTPANWNAVYNGLKSQDKPVAQLASEISNHFGDTEAAKNALIVLKNQKTAPEIRKKSLQLLAVRQRPELVKELPALLEDKNLSVEAIRAMAGFDNEGLAKLLIERYPKFTSPEKSEAIQTLASRPKSGWLLTQALSKNVISKKDIPTYVARQLRRVVGSGFVEVWGPIDHVAFDEKAYKKYKNLLTDKNVGLANAGQGRLIFKRTCAPCHKMYGEGGIIGPELTGSNRANLDYLLGNILDPSGEIQDDYKMVVITTRDGRTYVGNIAKETERQVTLRIVGQDAVAINKSDIQTRETTPVSMMPSGLLDNLSDKEITELIGYMRTTKQTELPK
ncbi:putative membrane-bound dehydrogenase domain-containing protein [Dyadobacter koreensis]|uniref:Putative membrane-bound dehydrogenase domain-containing protein n=1 Tax=Dyadobacter koreensis TaxID=408657 RepID=A0A1H6XY76_9BACT|nr:PVC-type heme-binding CxxCH protein [Dyadobacter koreensis]SEJ29535.1 putative membrane-bound dehydrogenase domain-containing protein [Dyadobacter koreensis]